MFDVVIAGAGLIGMLTARELHAAGLRVALFERGEPARESTWAGGGIISPLYPWRYPDPVNALAHWSQPRYSHLCEALAGESGIDPEYRPSGMLVFDREARDLGLDWAARTGARVEWIDGARCRELEPEVGSFSDGALWMPEIAQVRNPRIGRALAVATERSGVELITDREVLAVRVEAGRATGVITSQGIVEAGRVLIASGAWSAGLLAATGLGIPVEPVRGQMILYRAPQEMLRRIDLYRGHYLIPRADGRILVGSTLEYVGFDRTTTDAALRELRAIAVEMVPRLADCPVEHQWAGLRPGSPDGVPCIGPHPGIDRLYINTGHFRNGVVMGPASARLLADQLLGRRPILDPAPYLPENFAKKSGVAET